jgi:hypothetical protein
MASAYEPSHGDAAGAGGDVDLGEVRQRSRKPQKKPGATETEDGNGGRGAEAAGVGYEVTDSIERVFESEPVPSWREQVVGVNLAPKRGHQHHSTLLLRRGENQKAPLEDYAFFHYY